MQKIPDEDRLLRATELIIEASRILRPFRDRLCIDKEIARLLERVERDGDPKMWMDTLAAGASWADLERTTKHRRETMRPRIVDVIEKTKGPRSPYALAALHTRINLVTLFSLDDVDQGFTPADVRACATLYRNHILHIVGRRTGC